MRHNKPFNGDDYGMSWSNYVRKGGLAAALLRGWEGNCYSYENAVNADSLRSRVQPRLDGSLIPSIFA